MAGAARVGDSISGNVGSHASHVIGSNSGTNEDGSTWSTPIYCSGHSVSGSQDTGSSKVICEGQPAARVGDTGNSNCPCDGQGYNIIKGSSKVFIEGKPAARIGDSVDLHGQGTGTITSGSSKVIIGG